MKIVDNQCNVIVYIVPNRAVSQYAYKQLNFLRFTSPPHKCGYFTSSYVVFRKDFACYPLILLAAWFFMTLDCCFLCTAAYS